MKNQRKQLLIDRNVQGTVARRFLLYWGFCLLTMTLLLFFWRLFFGPPQRAGLTMLQVLREGLPWAAAGAALLPLVACDLLRLTNRFAGPIFRLRRSLETLARGGQQPPLAFRDGDYWLDLADSFNAVQDRMRRLENRIEELESQQTPA